MAESVIRISDAFIDRLTGWNPYRTLENQFDAGFFAG